MIKKFIYKALSFRLNYLFGKKLNRLAKGILIKAKNTNQFNEYKNYWKHKGLKANELYYLLYSEVSENPSPKYVPENLYYTYFEPALNNRAMLKAYSNKNLYQKIYDQSELFPKVFIRSINGAFYTAEYNHCNNLGKCIEDLKPEAFIIKLALDSGGGRGVELFVKNDNRYISNNGLVFEPNNISKAFGADFVIQEYIKQHAFFNRFNESSVNTIRVFTYRSVVDESIHILHSVLRIGQPGSIVDNQASGGMSCGIINSRLNAFAIDKKGVRYLKAGTYNFEERAEVPFFDNMLNEAKKIAKQNHYARLLGLDFCIDANSQIRLLEVNNANNEINFYQMNNGPLFGEFTDEIVNWCLNKPKTICLDFSVN